MISFRLATEEDALKVGCSLREIDRLEIARGTGHEPTAAPAVAVRESTIAWAAVGPRGPVAVFGVAPHKDPGVGIVWLLATADAEHEKRDFLVKGRYYVSLMSKLYPTLVNAVDAENTRSRRWLKLLGFTECAQITGKLTNHPFVFVRYQANV